MRAFVYRPDEFYECDAPQKVLSSSSNGSDTGCTSVRGGSAWNRFFIKLNFFPLLQFGGGLYEEVGRTTVLCQALQGVECHGNRTFRKRNVPCIL